ncbi:MAG: hypothetical protein JWO89_3601, partial [Verrucomicrobiaceae bacterium]|nr:hypothetical protein [Verrucomicrobiaceae bacterium]
MGVRSLLTLIAVWSVLTGIMAPATLSAAELDPPVVTAQTSSINAVVADDFTMLSVTVTGRSPYHYQWQHNGVPYNGGTDTSTFIVTMTVANSGVYRCVVTNADGAATSEPMILNFVPHSMIKQRSQRVLASENDFISFLADVFTNHPVLKYEWQFNGRKIPEEVANPQDNELFLSQMTLASAGTYRLLAG